MADLTANDVTVTLSAADQEFVGIGKKITFPVIAYGDSSLTYPSLGIPLPAKEHFGMKKEIKGIIVLNSDGKVYQYDKTNHKLRVFSGAMVEASGAQAATTLGLLVLGS